MSAIGYREIAAAVRVLTAGNLARYGIAGKESETSRFEAELATFMGTRRALAVNSGTNALAAALVGLGIGPGDEVLVPAYTWISTAAAPLLVGAIPVLVEVDETLTMDVSDLLEKLTPRSKAIIPVHMLNLPCNMDAIMAVARKHSLVVIEDACQAAGVRYGDRLLGTIGDVGVFSFNQHKNIKSGEGGALITNNERAYVRAKMFHDVGSFIRPDQPHVEEEPPLLGWNFRMPELSAAVLRPQLRRLDANIRGRKRRRERLIKRLAKSGLTAVPAPHNSEPTAAGLIVQFPSSDGALRFAQHRGVTRLLDTERHVYTNWAPLLTRQFSHPLMNPYRFPENPPRFIDRDSCPRTLDVLSRSCSVSLDMEINEVPYRLAMRRLFAT